MAFTKQRFFLNNLADADNITASSQGAGTIRTAKKTGTGTSNMTPTGSYTGATNLLYTVQCDGAGTIDSTATIRWKTSDTAAGSWEATGVSATTTAMSLSNGVEVLFDAGTLVLNDKFQFPAYAEYGPGNLFSYDRDDYWKSGTLTDIISNGGFDSATTGWTAYQCTIASVAGGQSGNCLEITRVTGTSQTAYQELTGLVVGEKYKFSGWVKSGTSGDEAFKIRAYLTPTVEITGTSSGTWTQYSSSFVATATNNYIHCLKDTATAGTMLFDTVSCYKLPSLEIDFGSAQNITAIALTDHNLSSSSVVTFVLNSSASWTSPAYSDDILDGANTDPSVDYLDETYRYGKVFFDDIDNTDGFISVSKLYIGTYTEVYSGELRGGTNWDTPRPRNRIEISNESIAGKERFHVYSEREEFPLNWTWLSLTALATLRTIWDAFGLISTGVKPFYFLHYWTDDESTLFFVTCVSSWNPKYHRGGHELSLTFHEDVITRKI